MILIYSKTLLNKQRNGHIRLFCNQFHFHDGSLEYGIRKKATPVQASLAAERAKKPHDKLVDSAACACQDLLEE